MGAYGCVTEANTSYTNIDVDYVRYYIRYVTYAYINEYMYIYIYILIFYVQMPYFQYALNMTTVWVNYI